jgi:hypothetical protein
MLHYNVLFGNCGDIKIWGQFYSLALVGYCLDSVDQKYYDPTSITKHNLRIEYFKLVI